MKKIFTDIIISVVMLLSLGVPAMAEGNVTINQTVFVDMSQNYWASSAVNAMAQQGIIKGYPDGTFKPEDTVSREEFAALICKTFNLDLTTPSKPTFYDVQPGSWSYNYIESAQQFLTGYYPPAGHPFFAPTIKATREDVAVALAKTLGYRPEDLKNPSILNEKISDVDSISYQLRDYVALAIENNLFNGYPDGTFRGQNPISRAEVATLLYKIIKSPAAADGPLLNVTVPETTSDATIYISGTTNRDAKVTINDKSVEVVDSTFKEGFKLDKEGSFDFVIVATLPGGKATTVKKTVKYTIGAPEIKLDNIPESINSSTIRVSGSVSDDSDNQPKLYINDKPVYYYGGTFSTNVDLVEGLNSLIFKAVNNLNKSTIVTKTVTFGVPGPILTVDNVPDATNSSTIRVTGSVKDNNDSQPKLYINDKAIYYYGGTFSTNINLTEGQNTITFKAVNNLNKSTVVTKTITFGVSGPTLKVDYIPDTINSSTIIVTGSVKDDNDSQPKLYINDKAIYYYGGTFSANVNLTEGINSITFKAVNNLDKSTVVTKTITFGVPGPALKVDNIPDTTNSNSITVTGSIKDNNDSQPKLYINDKAIYYYGGTFSANVNLTEGINTITFKAVNNLDKSTVVTKTITFGVPGPALKVDYISETTNSSTVTVTGSLNDNNDSQPKLYINDKAVYYYGGTFTSTINLTLGQNTLTFKAINNLGKETVVMKQITYNQ